MKVVALSDKSELFKLAWSNFPTGVSVITTIEDGGQVHGCTVNALCSVSIDPLLVIICLDHKTNTIQIVRERGQFSINILSENQSQIAGYFARSPEDRKGDVDVSYTFQPNGSAEIDGSVFFMDCSVVTSHEAGDHTVFVGQVEDVHLRDERPLLYYDRKFGKVSEDYTSI